MRHDMRLPAKKNFRMPGARSNLSVSPIAAPEPKNGVLSNRRNQKSMPEKPPVVLTIAGFDPSCGAGVTADVKTIAAHACYGVACITALTVQSTAGVRRIEVADPILVKETLEDLDADLDIAAVHIGMLGSAKVVKTVADFLQARNTGSSPARARLANIVLDPILTSSSGAELLDAPGTRLLIERLIPLSDV